MRKWQRLVVSLILLSQFVAPLLGSANELPQSSPLNLQGETALLVDQETTVLAQLSEVNETVYLEIPEGMEYQGAETTQPESYSLQWQAEERLLMMTPQVASTELTVPEGLPELPVMAEIRIKLIPRVSGSYLFQLTSQQVSSNELMVTVEEPESDTQEEGSSESEPELAPEPEPELEETLVSSTPEPETSIETPDALAKVVGEAEVGTWADFVTAIKNTAIHKINLTASFSNPKTSGEGDPHNLYLYALTRGLEINGNGHRLDFQGISINLGNPGSNQPTFYMHDIILAQRYAGGYSEDIVGSRLAAHSGKWRYRFGNLTTEASVQRLARAQYAEVVLYGNLKIDTRAENFYLGSLVMEEGTQYRGNVNNYDFSIFYYNLAARTTDTGYTQEFTVGDNSHVYLSQTQKAGASYPAIYYYYGEITIGKGATFNINLTGNAVRFNFSNSSMVVQRNATVNLRSSSTTSSVVNFAASWTSFIAEPGASITIIGMAPNESTVNLSNANTPTSTLFQLDSPRYFDIRNLGGKSTSRAISLGTTNRATNTVDITDGDISLWYTNKEIHGAPDFSFEGIGQLRVNGSGNLQQVTSENSVLQSSFETVKISRITSLKHNPTVEFAEITDAHLTIQGRVKLGEVPDDNGANAEGQVTTTPIYAGEGQIKGYIDDTYGIRHEGVTDNQGYISYRDTRFNQAEGLIKVGLRIRETEIRLFETVVTDVTPPEPVRDVQAIKPTDDYLNGQADEIGAKVTYHLNGTLVTENGTAVQTEVQADGSWQIPVTEILSQKDELQIFLTDTNGNRNPVKDEVVVDALFKAATKATVKGGELSLISTPSSFSFGNKLPISGQAASYSLVQLDGKLIVQDTRNQKNSFSLSAKMGQRLTSASGAELVNAIAYRHQGQDTIIDNESVAIYQGMAEDDLPIELSADWLTQESGLILKTRPGEVNAESYQGTIEWSLKDVPGNDD